MASRENTDFKGCATTDPLKPFLQSMARDRAGTAVRTAAQYRRVVDLLEASPCEISARPLVVAGFLDGIQASCLAGRGGNHRDVTVAYVGAGLVDGMNVRHVAERLAVVCSSADSDLVATHNSHHLDVVELADLQPWDLARATEEWIDEERRRQERTAIRDSPAAVGAFIAVDGPLPPSEPRSDLFGLVKRVLDTDWLPAQAHMPVSAGWRSPAFLIPGLRVGERDRLSAYVRLRT